MPKKSNHHINKTLSSTLIFSGAVLIVLAFVLMRVESIFGWVGDLLTILRPMLIGIALTFVLYKPNILINAYLEKLTKGKRFPCNGVAVLLTYLLFFGILTGIIGIIVPSFRSSIEEFTTKFSIYMANIQRGLENILNILQGTDGNGLLSMFNLNTDDIMKQVTNAASSIPEYIPEAMESVGEWASGLTGVLTDIVFGIAFSVYILAGRDRLKRQIKRIIKTFCSDATYSHMSHYSKLVFSTFSSFVSGQLMEALILGVLCFIGMTILGFPYAVMISVIIGVTNIIPIIGPIIGTIPGAIIYLMIDPWRAIWFVIFVIVMQQIDSNLIYPRVVGNSVGLPAIWILFAVTVGGGLFGVMGMIVGVPVMSLIYTILREKTSAAAEPDPKAGQPDDREPLFPELGEKASRLANQAKNWIGIGKTKLNDGFHMVMEQVADLIQRKDDTPAKPEAQAEEAPEPAENETEPAETESN
ncbi:MAG: AI-2E family transporter [Ruminococcus sp.]|nr:AI-2E family transporter [Ruminococcus sp.]